MKIIGRKSELRKVLSNVLSLALQPQLCNVIFHYRGIVLRQDVRISGMYLSAGFAWSENSQAQRKKDTGADLQKERDRRWAAIPGLSGALPLQILDGSVERVLLNETVARLLLVGATFLMTLQGRSKTRLSCLM